ncbi:MAG: cytochrome P450 [Gammaproteobacteria bacterium]|nr:cytochrome P450 [Gammaproteobacteria bacterium]
MDQFDVVTGLSRPLPAIVIAEMLGVPKKERHLFEKWSADMLGFVEILNPPQLRTAVEGEIAMRVYLQDLVEYKREHPGQDLISELIAVEEDGDKLTLDELYSTCELLLIAGHETTTRLIGSCLHLLMENPEQLQEVRASDELLEGAIEEALRFEPPIMAISRTVTESFIYMGKKFRKGQIIMLSIAGASRDPEVNDLPDRFDAHRDKVTHVSFGHGIHLCLGMSLARLEAQIGLRKLLDRYETINPLNDTPTWESNPFFRGLEHLHVKVSESSL